MQTKKDRNSSRLLGDLQFVRQMVILYCQVCRFEGLSDLENPSNLLVESGLLYPAGLEKKPDEHINKRRNLFNASLKLSKI